MKERDTSTIEHALWRIGILLGVKRAASIIGLSESMYQKASDPQLPSHTINVQRAVRLDRAIMGASFVEPEERQPFMLLAHAAELGLDITYRPAGAAPPPNETATALAFRLVELVGLLGGQLSVSKGGALDTEAIKQLATSRDRLIATVNQLVAAAEADGRIDTPTATRLRALGADA